jgi:hypothetical protein
MSLLHKQIERFNATKPRFIWTNDFGQVLCTTKGYVVLGNIQFEEIRGDNFLDFMGPNRSFLNMRVFNRTSNRILIFDEVLRKIRHGS